MGLQYTGERPLLGAMPAEVFHAMRARYILAESILSKESGRKVLDVGCGTGLGSGFLAQHDLNVTGLDVDIDSAKWGSAQLTAKPFVVAVARGERLPFASGSFDSLVAFECIEHMDSPHTFISEAYRVLTPNGLLLCSVPNSINEVLAESLNNASNPYHLQRFTVSTMRHLLDGCFKTEQEWGQKFRHVDHYAYLLLNHSFWRHWGAVPVLGTLSLEWRRRRSARHALQRKQQDGQGPTSYEDWRPHPSRQEWAPQSLQFDTSRIPETLMFQARRA